MRSRAVLRNVLAGLPWVVLSIGAAAVNPESWLEEVAPLIGTEERAAFLRLADDAQRQKFIRRFWAVRDPFPQTERNELQEGWTARLEQARRRWGRLDDDRARVLLLRGEPDSSFTASCPGAPDYEVWTYEPSFGVKHRSVIVFALGAGAARIWWPGPDTPALISVPAEDCSAEGEKLSAEWKWIRIQGVDQYRALVERALARPRPNPRDWYAQRSATASVTPPEELRDVTRPGVHLLRPADELLVGNTRFEARVDRVAGAAEESQISRVSFLLDGRRVYTRNHPPYAVSLDLGPVPRQQKLEVEGLSESGEVLARDEMLLNSGAQRFSVRLLEPQPGRSYRHSLRARVQVEPPQGQRVEKVELWLDEKRVSTIFQPPYAQQILLPEGQEAGYVRAVAYLDDGRAAEDVVLLNTPVQPEQMTVRLVELFSSVVDRDGRPVTGVDPAKFKVFEDGVPQRLRIAEPVGDMPIRVVALIDTSLSMREELEKTRAAALQFMKRTLRPMDQAAVITFNIRPNVAVPLTNDLEELQEGLTGLLAEEQTSLYDSLAYSLQYLGGVKGQRAVLLLSDGMDRSSRLTFEQALESARRAGIVVYTIGLALPEATRREAEKKLDRIAAETGGRSFFVQGTEELDGVYAAIEEELRAQYHLAYQSTNNSPDDDFRAVRVEVGKGMEARTISGYYP